MCMTRGQWEWWVCKWVPASGLYIAPLSAPRLSLGAVLKFQPNSSGQSSTKNRLYLTATDNLRTATEALSKKHFISILSNGPDGLQGHWNCRMEIWWQTWGGVEAKVETDCRPWGSCSTQAWGPALPLLRANVFKRRTMEYFLPPVGNVDWTERPSSYSFWYFDLKCLHQLYLCDCSSQFWESSLGCLCSSLFLGLWPLWSFDGLYHLLSFGSHMEYSCDPAVMTVFFLASSTCHLFLSVTLWRMEFHIFSFG